MSGDEVQQGTEALATGRHTFSFDRFNIRGAIHYHTELTIFDDGRWEAESHIGTIVSSFKPLLTLSIEFFERDTGLQIPVGNVADDWQPKELWKQKLAALDEKTIKSSGKSDYIKQHFSNLSCQAEGKLKLRITRPQGLLARLFS